MLMKLSVAVACETHDMHALQAGDDSAWITGADSPTPMPEMVATPDPEGDSIAIGHHAACAHCGCCAHAFAASAGPVLMPMLAASSHELMSSFGFVSAHAPPGLRPPIA